jgi:hypothetical protein
MTKLATRSNKLSGVLAWELEPESGVCRETVTVVVEAGLDVGAVVTSNGAGKYVWVEAADVATLNADVCVVLTADKDIPSMTVGDNSITVLKRGHAKIVGTALTYKDTLTTNQKNTVLAALKVKDILNTVAV